MNDLEVYNIDLFEYGFTDNTLETESHIVTYVYYDIGRLMIQSKPKHGGDSVYVEGYFRLDNFRDIIYSITGFRIKKVKSVKLQLSEPCNHNWHDLDNFSDRIYCTLCNERR